MDPDLRNGLIGAVAVPVAMAAIVGALWLWPIGAGVALGVACVVLVGFGMGLTFNCSPLAGPPPPPPSLSPYDFPERKP